VIISGAPKSLQWVGSCRQRDARKRALPWSTLMESCGYPTATISAISIARQRTRAGLLSRKEEYIRRPTRPVLVLEFDAYPPLRRRDGHGAAWDGP
jgi:hypothetical protein